jgi:hypothetical protein
VARAVGRRSMCDIRHYANGALHKRGMYPSPVAIGRRIPILTKNLSFRVHVGGVGVGLKSHNLNGFFLLINGLSAGGRPLWTPDALARVGETRQLLSPTFHLTSRI